MIADFQRALAAACLDADPVARLRACLDDPAYELSAEERGWLAGLDPDGLRITALLVKKERFQRIVGADAGLAAEFEADPEAFTGRFARYCAACPPHWSAGEEARAFRRWRGDVGAG